MFCAASIAFRPLLLWVCVVAFISATIATVVAVAALRRFQCVCWLPAFSVSLLTHPAAEGPSGVSRRCVAGLRGGGCLCLGVTTRDGGVSLWLHREKEDPLPQVGFEWAKLRA